jgi:hypothetical protein
MVYSTKYPFFLGLYSNTPCQRFSTAAAEINGTIYVAGGYDGTEYLK